MNTITIREVEHAFGCSHDQAVEIIEAVDRLQTAIEARLAEHDLLTDTAAFLAARADWKAQGCPNDHPYARLCAEVAAGGSGPAIGFRDGETYRLVEL
jgi:hypothetical protein